MPTRIDILFQGVQALSLPVEFEGLTIETLESKDEQWRPELLQQPAGSGQSTFQLSSSLSGWVSAAVVAHHEDRGEYNDPSYLWAEF